MSGSRRFPGGSAVIQAAGVRPSPFVARVAWTLIVPSALGSAAPLALPRQSNVDLALDERPLLTRAQLGHELFEGG